ncbi:prepilin peptidase [Edaphobacter dinghuensis]|uniref:Type 4 prepilin-like proteins leader peptide-processing enzyme n=1 Tax=Edaphobacter dinghuensis TaxID=1560005 RepID=A0A917HE01_9BACT|nr:A24 family peptidase [Edaphobacter dinghuensis]GGG75576.1 type 4 prepilin-like proteins leader peptide-processing enzyme [Edaphobacter dinghuensis]
MTPLIAYEAVGFALGLIFGSFLNVCIARLPQGQSVVHPRSRCPQCGAGIRWYDNLPVLSWLLLRGRCRDCKHPIALHYPLVEIGLGLWFMAQAADIYMLLAFSKPHDLVSDVIVHVGIALLGFLLIGLMVMDWQTQLLPDVFTLGGIAVSFFLTCVRAIFLAPNEDDVILHNQQIQISSPGSSAGQGNVFLTGPERLLGEWLLAVSIAVVILLVVRWLYKALRHREGMGLGDVKLFGLLAAFLGFWSATLALFLGVLFASAYAVILLARGKAGAASKLAFGSFLAAGGLIAALYGEKIINAYKTLL